MFYINNPTVWNNKNTELKQDNRCFIGGDPFEKQKILLYISYDYLMMAT